MTAIVSDNGGRSSMAAGDKARVWSPLVEWTRRRHLKFGRRLEQSTEAPAIPQLAECIVSAGM